MSDELPTAARVSERIRLFPPELDVGPEEGFTREKDLFERKSFGEQLTRIVQRLENPAVLLLDGRWGIGKTIFVKMWLGELSKAKIPSIYFDAFANDYHEDAFLTIAGEIVAKAEELRPRHTKSLDSFKTNTIKVAKALGRAGLKIAVRTASAGILTGEEITSETAKLVGDEVAKVSDDLLKERLESHKADRNVFDQFKNSLAEISQSLSRKINEASGLEEQDTLQLPPLVFVIDELDRCRPSFALEVLEKLKHFFMVPGVTFVLVSSLEQLEAAVCFRYGNINARSYLEKFYHLRLLFPTASKNQPDQTVSARYLAHLFPEKGGAVYATIITQFCRVHPLSLRTLERVSAYSKIAIISIPPGALSIPQIIAILCLAKVIDPDMYGSMREGTASFEQIDALFRFRDWRDEYDTTKRHRIAEYTELWWRWLSRASIAADQRQHFEEVLLRYGHFPPERVIQHFCDVVDGFHFPEL